MKRAIIALVIVAVLLACAAGVEFVQGRIPREDPLGRRLLYRDPYRDPYRMMMAPTR